MCGYGRLANKLKERGYQNIYGIDNEDFYNYENKIYEQISEISDIMFIVDNNEDIEDTIEIISNIIEQKIDIRKKVSYERRI